MSPLALLHTVLAQQTAVLVTVHATRGSVPREVGAWMAVTLQQLISTVGGGRLELDATALAQRLLQSHMQGEPVPAQVHSFALGPSLGQCCGGQVSLQFEVVGPADQDAVQQRLRPKHWPLGLFGGGHVGQALVQVLERLPFDVTWVDSRDGVFPEVVPANVQCEHSDPVQAAVADLPQGARVLIMSFSHAEDLDIVAACLQRQRAAGDLPYVGLIGSHTKWATFRRRLAERGYTEAELAHVTCPIGVPGVNDKRPEIIAVAVAAQLLQVNNKF
ncbi:xanthine dehydrogenase accessory protein XdhC [Rhodoferax bucti]|uniref:xanthine dehydrogenase accessory protein XdhC n=1 Tax=Rhodoferax bucti TaxID=2576305 RepID=UPI0011089A0F|nr:xanthine dehydrogenase accessory protein XdhC [Rhodoferax bucti]